MRLSPSHVNISARKGGERGPVSASSSFVFQKEKGKKGDGRPTARRGRNLFLTVATGKKRGTNRQQIVQKKGEERGKKEKRKTGAVSLAPPGGGRVKPRPTERSYSSKKGRERGGNEERASLGKKKEKKGGEAAWVLRFLHCDAERGGKEGVRSSF